MRSGVRIGAMLSWIVAACFTAVAAAHHSTAEFDYTKQVTIKGTVKEVQWTNPHSYIQLIADGEGGEKIQWSVEIGSPSLNINMGWRKNSVKVGDVVTMNLSPARNGKPYGTLRVLTFADGQKLEGVAARVGGGPGGAAASAGRAAFGREGTLIMRPHRCGVAALRQSCSLRAFRSPQTRHARRKAGQRRCSASGCPTPRRGRC